jgi:hypothetical protein
MAPVVPLKASETPSYSPTLSSAPSFCEVSIECNITFAEDSVASIPSSTGELVKLLQLNYWVENSCVSRAMNVSAEITYCDDFTISNFSSGTLVEFEYSKECDLEKIGIRNYIVCDNFILNVTATDGIADFNCLAYPPPILIEED